MKRVRPLESLAAELATCSDQRVLQMLRWPWSNQCRSLIEAEARRRGVWG